MAKGNMFQGMARGKVGDVVFYRADGEQISRVRNRHPKNPKTIAQLYQRAIMATIVQAYSAGKEIFDHSFQGKQVGNENMRAFLSRNMKVLRSAISVDVNDNVPVAQQTGRVVAPASISPIPVVGLIVSEGQLTQSLFTINPATSANPLSVSVADYSSIDTPANEWGPANGLISGDIYTFVGFFSNDNVIRFKVDGATGNYGTQYDCRFGWMRFTVKETLPTTAINAVTLGDIFDIEQDGEIFAEDIAKEKFSGLNIDEDTFAILTSGAGTFGIIRSREDEKVRSTTVMQALTTNTQFGIVSQYLLNAWKESTNKLGNSELILEGGNEGDWNVVVGAPDDDDDSDDSDNPPMGGD